MYFSIVFYAPVIILLKLGYFIRSDIWFDDVDIEEIEHAIGKKLKFSSDKHMESNDHDVTAKEDAQNSDRKPRLLFCLDVMQGRLMLTLISFYKPFL